MRFLQIHTFYPQYIESLYSRFKLLHKASFQQQIDVLISDAFSAAHMISPYMKQYGYESRLVIANCKQSQTQWIKEHCSYKLHTENWIREISRKQIDEYEPDILYLSNPIDFEGSFIRTLNHKPKLILGWRAATFPYNIDWSGFDVMLSSLEPLLQIATQRGAKRSELFSPGFPASIAERIKEIKPSKDIVFVGQYTSSQHTKRGHYLQEIAKTSETNGYESALHLSGNMGQIPSCLKRHLAEPVYGLAMHKALRKGRIAFDARGEIFIVEPEKKTKIDIGGKDTANMRIFEATGSGVFLLTEHFENVETFFRIGDEIETFSDRKELVDKLDYFLAHPERREEIAAQGQARCLKDHSMERAAQELDRIIRKHLALKYTYKCNRFVCTKKSSSGIESEYCKDILADIHSAINNNEFDNALRLTSVIKAKKLDIRNIDYYRANAFFGSNQIQSAIEATKEELRRYPDNFEAVSFLKRIYSQNIATVNNNMKNIDEFENIYSHVNAYTMLGRERLASLFTIAKTCCEHDLPGNFVECGVAAGGSSALLAWVIKTYSKRPRFLYCFDTFEGMPDPTIEDSHANTPANETGWGAGTCAAPIQSLIDICEKLGAASIIQPTKGLFKHTLPQKTKEIGHIAFLHMDGDWYESTNDILENLYEQVIPQGYIQVDDYGHWDGCKKALHEYESKLGEKFDLHRIDNTGVWFKKPSNPASVAMSRLLNLGCGKRHHPAWTNVDFKSDSPDVIAHDLSKGLPFSDESFEAIYHSHLLEHFSKNHAPVFLKDCFHALKPGGIIRVVVPDLESIARLYLLLLEKSVKGDEEARKRYDWITLELFDQMVRNHSGGAMLEYWRQNPMPAEDFIIERLGSEVKGAIGRIRSKPDAINQSGEQPNHALEPRKLGQFRLSGEVHQWMYDRYSLGKLLQEAGFEDIKVCLADESRIPDFNSYLLDIEADGSIRKPDSLFMEARKPLTLSQEPDINTSPSLSRVQNHSRSNLNISYRSNLSIRNTNPNIVHLCTLDHGGAGVAALRLHLGLLAKGMNSDMLVLHTNSGKPRVHAVRTMTGHQSQAAWKVAHDRWQKVLAGHPRRPLGLELFTDTTSDALITNHNIFKQADIINLHWIPGLIDIQSMPNILSEKRVIWTLHDQNAFTGGCHYTGDCLKFKTFCHTCPQLGSKKEKDLAFRQWQIKKMAYDAIDFEIITPSKWLAEQAKASALFAGRQISVIPYGLPLGLFQPRPTHNLRQKFGLCEGDFVLMFGAHAHTNRKGFAYLKQLLEVIPTQLMGKRVVAAAFGHLDGGLSKRIPLLELGFIAEPSRLAEIYSMADVYVLPAVEDNLPNTVMEAMACGTPVVGFEIGGMPDMVRHGETGWLAQLGDIDGLVQGAMWARKFGGNARKSIATLARQYFNDRVQAKKYGRLYSEVPSSRDKEASPETLPSIPLCDPNHFEHFSYAKNNHFIAFSGMDLSLYGKPIDPQRSDLKRYQDTLILTFIAANIPTGARILEVGGGNSRILAHLAAKYECWNIDKFEGVGSGPKQAEQAGYKIVLDYMGNNNPELPDDYFDFVFSISALEHTPNDPELYASILRDITKALKPDGWSLHLFDVVFKPEGFWTNHFLPYLFQNTSASYPMPDPEVMQKDQDTYFMSNDAYDEYWKKITGKPYEEFGLPTSINILWQKLSKTSKNNTHKYYPEFKKNNDIPKRPIIQTRRTRPSISIVTPSFNQAEFLEECIDSILSQNYLNLEYVIMDGGSTDGSVDIIKKYKKYLKYWQSKKDLGQYWAINEGFKHTTGEVMAWLNSDDKYHSQSLYKIANFFDTTPESEWVMGRPTVWNTQGELIHIVEKIPSWSQKIYLEGNYGPPHIQQESTFWKRSIWDKSGGYIDTNLKYAGDMELWSRFFRHTNLHILDDLIGGFRTQPNSKTYISMDLYNKEADIIISRERKIYNYE